MQFINSQQSLSAVNNNNNNNNNSPVRSLNSLYSCQLSNGKASLTAYCQYFQKISEVQQKNCYTVLYSICASQ